MTNATRIPTSNAPRRWERASPRAASQTRSRGPQSASLRGRGRQTSGSPCEGARMPAEQGARRLSSSSGQQAPGALLLLPPNLGRTPPRGQSRAAVPASCPARNASFARDLPRAAGILPKALQEHRRRVVCLGQPGGRVSPGASMEPLMGRIIDVREVQRALDRAARDARHGPRDVRAGRFVHAMPGADRPLSSQGPSPRGGNRRPTPCPIPKAGNRADC
jgi:hypothetical protein